MHSSLFGHQMAEQRLRTVSVLDDCSKILRDSCVTAQHSTIQAGAREGVLCRGCWGGGG